MRRFYCTLIALMFSVATLWGCARHATPSNSKLPSLPSELLSFKPLVPEQWTLPNGLTVMFQPDDELPLVTGSISFRSGSFWEPEGSTGAVAALGDLMRQGGAGPFSADALDEELEKLSATVSSSIAAEFGVVGFSGLSSDFERIFALATNVLLEPRFERSRIELWKGQSLEGIRRRPDDPWTVAGISFGQLLFGATPYGRVAVEDDVKRISTNALRTLHTSMVRPDGAILVVSGSVDRATVERVVQEKLGGWASRGGPIGPLPPVDFEPQPGIFFIPLPLSQASVYIGHQGVSRLTPDYPALDTFNQVFGSGFFGSRLMKKVRAELGLVYGIFGGIAPGAVKGKNFIAFQTKGVSTGEAIKYSINELVRLQTETVPTEELREVQRAITNSFIFKFESPDKAVARRANQILLGYPEDFDDTYLTKISAVTPADILTVAKNRWDLGKLVVVVVGNETAYSSLEEMLSNPPSYFKGVSVQRLKFDQKLLK